MNWQKVEESGYFPAYRCSVCGDTIIVEDESIELPCYCRNCEETAET